MKKKLGVAQYKTILSTISDIFQNFLIKNLKIIYFKIIYKYTFFFEFLIICLALKISFYMFYSGSLFLILFLKINHTNFFFFNPVNLVFGIKIFSFFNPVFALFAALIESFSLIC